MGYSGAKPPAARQFFDSNAIGLQLKCVLSHLKELDFYHLKVNRKN